MDCEREELIQKLSELVKCDPAVLQDFPIGLPNLRMPTMGGFLFWEDVAEIQGWRMQRNIVTGHWRLLDPDNMRCAWGADDKMVDIFTKAAQAMEKGEGNVTDELEEEAGESEVPDEQSKEEMDDVYAH